MNSSRSLFNHDGVRLILTSLFGFEKLEKLKLNDSIHEKKNTRLIIQLATSLKNLKEIQLFNHDLDQQEIDTLIKELPGEIGFVIQASEGCITRGASESVMLN